MIRAAFAVIVGLLASSTAFAQPSSPVKILFLGDNGHHRPADRFAQIKPILEKRGIEVVYTDKMDALNAKNLAEYDGLLIYSNTVKISDEQEKALLDYVAGGKGFIPVHCASYCFLNSPKYIELVGAQFKSHGTGTFTTTIAEPDHPIMKGYKTFESFDETYVHTKHNTKDRIVLEYRVDGKGKEPWTWVRTHGKGRIFYTAWGHDQRTWSKAGFHDLLVRGIFWTTRADQIPGAAPAVKPSARGPFPVPDMTPQRKDVKPFEYADVGNKIPNYKGKGTLSSMQKPLEAEESLKHLVVPKGFKAELFAADPQIHRPICMAWDERGRLWIAESVDYPNSIQPADKGNDRIVICEDTKGTGRADKFTVFADKLSIPTSMCFWQGGLLVFENRRTLFLKDTDGDDVADVREVLFSGWGMGDTHGGVSNMQYGLDNWIWAMQGYNLSKVSLAGEVHSFRQGFFRFKPPSKSTQELKDKIEGLRPIKEKADADYQLVKEQYDSKLSFTYLEENKEKKAKLVAEVKVLSEKLQAARLTRDKLQDQSSVLQNKLKESGGKLEFVRSTNNNTWGLGISEEGLIFGSTANGNPSVYMPIPNRYYEAVKGWTPSLVLGGIADSYNFKAITNKVRQVDFHGGYTAAAGHALYTARNYPQEYWNRTAFVAEPTGHIVGTFVLRPDGSNFSSSNPFNLLASDDEWTAPIMAEVGPDGNVWVIDWYNYIVQHNPTPAGFKTGKGAAYETDLRDKTHGRIYRIVPDPKPQGEVPRALGVTLKDATPEKLVETLTHDNMFWRKHAQRLLVERGKRDVLPALYGLVRNHDVDAIGLNVGAIHALWSMHGLGALDGTNKDATAVAFAALRHPSAGVRRNAVQVLPRQAESTLAILEANLLEDADAQVRLAALLALADLPPSAGAGEAIVKVLQDPLNTKDRWIPDAATCAAARNSEFFLKALSARAHSAQSKVDNNWRDVIVVLPDGRSKLTDEDAVAVAGCKSVDAATPLLATTGQLVTDNGNHNPKDLLGVGQDYANVRQWKLSSGKFFSESAINEAERVCVIGQTIVKKLFPEGNAIGQTVRIKQQPFRIVGVLASRGVDVFVVDQDDLVLMPYTTVRKRLHGSAFSTVNIVLARAASPDLRQAVHEINDALRQQRQIKPGEGADFEIRGPEIKKTQPAAANPKTIATAGIVAEHYARGGGKVVGPDLGKMGKVVAPNSVGEILSRLADADQAVAEAVVRGLAKGWPRNNTPMLTEAEEKDLLRLTARLSPGSRALLVQLASSWGIKGFDNFAAEIPRLLLVKIADEKLKAEERIAAARELLEFQPGDKKLPSTLLELITPRTPPDLAAGLLRALQLSEAPQTGQLIVEKLPSLTPAARSVGIGVLLARPEWTAVLLEHAEKGKILLSELSLDQKQALADHPSADVKRRAVDLLKKGGALPNADRQKVIEELLPITKEKGDAAAGKLVFKNACSKCHMHSGEGTRIGPDLTGVAVHTKEHLLIDIIDPSRSVEGNFRIYQVSTTKGLFYTGMLASESKTAVELFDAEGKKLTILREAIDEMTALPKSLMPDGFEKLLSRQELTDLLEFLTQRGKYLPLPLDKAATIVSTRGMFYSEDAQAERLIFPDWKPRTFEGVPFQLVDPQGERVPNAIMLYSPQGKLPPKMPKSVSLPCNTSAKAIHFLSGVSGWGFPYSKKQAVAMTVRLHYEDGKTEDHDFKNGEHFADYIRRVDVPGSKFAFDLDGRQIRYLVVHPKRAEKIVRIELVKGPDASAPVVMAVTVEGREQP